MRVPTPLKALLSARLPVNLIGSPINYANRLIGPPITSQSTAALPACCVQAFGAIDPDGTRFLLGDHVGRLYLLVLAQESGCVTGLKLEPLGTTSAASTIS